MYPFLADAVLLVHCAFVAFVVLMVPLVYVGGVCHWAWVRYRWLRLVHLSGVLIVAVQSWVGVICPLTHLEDWLRMQGGQAGYAGSFMGYWLQQLLYWDLPPWMFVSMYTVFALLVGLTWLLVPPQGGGRDV
jgi:Protein of Unknown function (DUF2784)